MSERHTRVLRLTEVKARTGLSRTGIYDRIRDHAFPAPVPMGGRVVAWVESEVEEWIVAQIAEARKPRAASSEVAA